MYVFTREKNVYCMNVFRNYCLFILAEFSGHAFLKQEIFEISTLELLYTKILMRIISLLKAFKFIIIKIVVH